MDANWQVATLSQHDVQKVQQWETQIKADGGKDIVLIAYQRK